jgi:DNA-binding protein YbaB
MKKKFKQVAMEGNKGGDYLYINTDTDNDVLDIEVGHCCIHVFDASVPVELVTALFNDMMIRFGTPEKFIQSRGWPQEFKDELIAKISRPVYE